MKFKTPTGAILEPGSVEVEEQLANNGYELASVAEKKPATEKKTYTKKETTKKAE
jgi:hypothetical protein